MTAPKTQKSQKAPSEAPVKPVDPLKSLTPEELEEYLKSPECKEIFGDIKKAIDNMGKIKVYKRIPNLHGKRFL